MRFPCVLVLVVACYTSSSDQKTTPVEPPPMERTSSAPPPKERTIEDRAYELMENLLVAFESAGTDCVKLAENLNAFADEHAEEVKELQDFEKDLTPEQKERWNERTKNMMERIMPSMTACMSNQDVMNAMQRLTQ
jgi:hypothetical protein